MATSPGCHSILERSASSHCATSLSAGSPFIGLSEWTSMGRAERRRGQRALRARLPAVQSAHREEWWAGQDARIVRSRERDPEVTGIAEQTLIPVRGIKAIGPTAVHAWQLL